MTRELAFIDAQLARARTATHALLERYEKLRRRRRARQLSRGPLIPKRERLLEARNKVIRCNWVREAAVDQNAEELRNAPDSLEPGGRFDAMVVALKVESKAKKRHQRESRARELIARKYDAAGTECDYPKLVQKAAKLRQARRVGVFGVRESTQELVIRMRDRSGLIREDPSEARERSAELIERVEPSCLQLKKRGYRLFKAVFSEPNVPAGALPFGKSHIYSRFRSVIIGRNEKGEHLSDLHRKLPEIVGAFAIQEDPLSARGTWNVHLNVILVVDPAKCTPLPEEEWPIDPETGKPKPDPATDYPGMFSFMKLRHVWGSEHQVEIRPLEGTRADFIAALRECIKYAAKTVSEKSIQKFEEETGESLLEEPPTERPPALELTIVDPAAELVDERPRTAPPMIYWPPARVVEWDKANTGFRRVRMWGLLYRLGKLDRPALDDSDIRWLGRIFVTPWAITVQLEIWDAPVDSIQENKSYRAEPLPRAQSPPRAGPSLAL